MILKNFFLLEREYSLREKVEPKDCEEVEEQLGGSIVGNPRKSVQQKQRNMIPESFKMIARAQGKDALVRMRANNLTMDATQKDRASLE